MVLVGDQAAMLLFAVHAKSEKVIKSKENGNLLSTAEATSTWGNETLFDNQPRFKQYCGNAISRLKYF